MDNTRDKPSYQTLHFDQQKKIRTEIQVGCFYLGGRRRLKSSKNEKAKLDKRARKKKKEHIFKVFHIHLGHEGHLVHIHRRGL